MLPGQLRKYGMNTLGNWSDDRLLGTTGMPLCNFASQVPGDRAEYFQGFPGRVQ